MTPGEPSSTKVLTCCRSSVHETGSQPTGGSHGQSKGGTGDVGDLCLTSSGEKSCHVRLWPSAPRRTKALFAMILHRLCSKVSPPAGSPTMMVSFTSKCRHSLGAGISRRCVDATLPGTSAALGSAPQCVHSQCVHSRCTYTSIKHTSTKHAGRAVAWSPRSGTDVLSFKQRYTSSCSPRYTDYSHCVAPGPITGAHSIPRHSSSAAAARCCAACCARVRALC